MAANRSIVKSAAALTLLVVAVTSATAAPIIPTIAGHDFGIGAYNSTGPAEYQSLGTSPDRLAFTASYAHHEVTSYTQNWPVPPVLPVWDVSSSIFGGDFALGVEFTGQDAPQGPLDVSLVGQGVHDSGATADLEIWGMIIFGPTDAAIGLLWAVDLTDVALYGHSGSSSYVLEGTGPIVGGIIAQRFGLVGQEGALRGHLDFIGAPAGWMPTLYNPVTDGRNVAVRAAFSGETGLVPEPAAVALILAGLLLRRR